MKDKRERARDGARPFRPQCRPDLGKREPLTFRRHVARDREVGCPQPMTKPTEGLAWPLPCDGGLFQQVIAQGCPTGGLTPLLPKFPPSHLPFPGQGWAA